MALVNVDALVFGEVDRGHDLVCSTLPIDQVPNSLWRVTDRPRELPPDITWDAIFGCGPVEGGWAVWRVFDDPRRRAGMVQTHVRYITERDIVGIHDIWPVLDSLPQQLVDAPKAELLRIPSEENSIATSTNPRYFDFMKVWSDSQRERPVILPDDLPFLEFLRSMWASLWPAARREIACRTAFGPESFDLADRNLIVMTPRSCIPRWSGYPVVVEVDKDAIPQDGVVALLCGRPAPRVRALLDAAQGSLPGRSEDLAKVDRVAEWLGRMRDSSATWNDLAALLRHVAQLLPEPSFGAMLKGEITERVSRSLMSAHFRSVLSLSNLNLRAFPDAERALGEAVTARVSRSLGEHSVSEGVDLMLRAQDVRLGEWWRDSVVRGLARCFESEIDTSSKRGWPCVDLWEAWRSEPGLIRSLSAYLPSRGASRAPLIEEALVRTCPTSLQQEVAGPVAEVAVDRGWSALHGAVVSAAWSPGEAIFRQCAFKEDPRPGLRVLARRLGADMFLRHIAANPHSVANEIAIEQIRADPALLRDIDPEQEGWRQIWTALVRSGVRVFDYVSSPRDVVHGLFRAVLKRSEISQELLRWVAADREGHLLDVGDAKDLLNALESGVATRLTENTARQWLARLFAEQECQRPDGAIAEKVVTLLAHRGVPRSARGPTLSMLLDWFPSLPERVVVQWVSEISTRERMAPDIVDRIAAIAVARRWEELARKVFDEWRRSERDDLLQLALGMKEVLPWYMALFLPNARLEPAFQAALRPLTIFYAYAREDERLRDELEKHLQVLKRRGLVDFWHYRIIDPGMDWKREHDKHLDRADIILCLVSSDFISSDYWWGAEGRRAMERHKAGKAVVVPVIARECLWRTTEFGKLEPLPRYGRPITSWTNRDEAFTSVAEGIERIVQNWPSRGG